MKTLLFTPSYLEKGRLDRNLKWLDYYNKLKGRLKFDEILLVDNASSKQNKDILKLKYPEVKLIECEVFIDRKPPHQYGYWYSAFGKAAKYALDNSFDKIVHLDSDVFIFSDRIVDYINNFQLGWVSQWCNIHNFPESTFQLIGSDQIKNMYEHMTRDFLAYYPQEMAETHIPFTYVEKRFIGDRFPEKGLIEQQSEWDFCGQCPLEMKVTFKGMI